MAENPGSEVDRSEADDETWARLRQDLSPDALSTAAASEDRRTRSFANLILGLVDPARQTAPEVPTRPDGTPKYRLATPSDPLPD